MGRDTGWPSMMGLGHPPAALSKPLRLKMIFTFALVRVTVRLGLVHRLGMPANAPSIVTLLVQRRHGDTHGLPLGVGAGHARSERRRSAVRSGLSLPGSGRCLLEPDGIGPGFAPGIVPDQDARIGAGPGAQIKFGFGNPLLADALVFRGTTDEEDSLGW